MKMGSGNMYFDWVTENMKEGTKIGLDTNQVSIRPYKQRLTMFEKNGIKLVSSANLVDEIWGEEKPPMPNEMVFVLAEEYAGQATLSKFKFIMSKVSTDSSMIFVSSLSDIAWTLNLRGSDIEFNPLFFSYLVLKRDGENIRADLFIKQEKVADLPVQEYLSSINVTVHDYYDVEKVITDYKLENKKITVNPMDCSAKMHLLFTSLGFEISEEADLIPLLKGTKNLVQQEGMRQCNIRDCSYIMKYFAYLEEEL